MIKKYNSSVIYTMYVQQKKDASRLATSIAFTKLGLMLGGNVFTYKTGEECY